MLQNLQGQVVLLSAEKRAAILKANPLCLTWHPELRQTCYPHLLQQLSGTTMVRAFKGGKCAQLNIDNSLVGPAETILGAQKGDCTSVGYTHDDGAVSTYIPLYGNVTFEQYSKPTLQLLQI